MVPCFLLFLWAVHGLCQPVQAAPPEQRYLQRRDAWATELEQANARLSQPPPGINFQNASVALDARNAQALTELAVLLRKLIGPVQVAGFAGTGQNNLQTLLPEVGFGMLDGLRWQSGSTTLVVTSVSLLTQFKADGKAVSHWRAWSNSADFYHTVFDADASVTPFATLPLSRPQGVTFAHALLGLYAQEIGPFVPQNLYVFAVQGQQVFLFKTQPQTPIGEIAQCQREWAPYGVRIQAAQHAHAAAKQHSPALFKRMQDLEGAGFDAWRNCYARLAKNQPFFKPLQQQAQALLDRVLPPNHTR